MSKQRTYLWLGIWAGGLILLLSVLAMLSPQALQRGATASENVQGPADKIYRLRTGIVDGNMVFIGDSGGIKGQMNPTFEVQPDDIVQVILMNGDGGTHDIAIPRFNVRSKRLMRKGDTTSVKFRVDRGGSYPYFCTVAGHRIAGMEGTVRVGASEETAPVRAPLISRNPADLPGPVGSREPTTVEYEFTAIEQRGRIAEGASYTYFTFNGQVPGPFLRVKVEDRVEIHLSNPDSNSMVHSIDFHAATGPGGGAAVMQVPPGEKRSFTFKALKPGLYVYHCASPMVAHHIANGMYGMILVEPGDGLSEVDHEFYVMQQEIYTSGAPGSKGNLQFNDEKLLNENPEYVVLNGSVGALTEHHPLRVKTGETARIYFGVGGPNLTSSFHVIGEIMDRVYPRGSISSDQLQDIQTTTVAPGGATIAEIRFEVPGTYKIVDHALSRLQRGLVGYIIASGPENRMVFHKGPADQAM